MRKKAILLAAVFGVAVVGASFNIKGDKAYALTNTKNLDTTGVKSIDASFDGRYIAFLSDESTLVSGDTNNVDDAFLRDTQTNTTTRISVSSSGTQANARTEKAIITGNGRYVLMTSYATNLTSGVLSSASSSSVFLRDIKLGTTTLIESGIGGSGVSYYAEALSEDARYIYYSAQGGAYSGELLVKNMTNNTVSQIDTDSSGIPANQWVNFQSTSTSCDGRFVTFVSPATNLVSGDTNGYNDVFLVDRSGSTPVISDVTIGGNGNNYSPRLSCDGNHIVFSSDASNLLASDTNSQLDYIDYNISQNTFSPVSLDSSGNQYGTFSSANGGVSFGYRTFDVSVDGRYIAYSVYKTISGFTSAQIEVRDMLRGTTTVISPAYNGFSKSDYPAVLSDGKTALYAYTDNYGLRDIYTVFGY